LSLRNHLDAGEWRAMSTAAILLVAAAAWAALTLGFLAVLVLARLRI
jgi:hypothetical protein